MLRRTAPDPRECLLLALIAAESMLIMRLCTMLLALWIWRFITPA
tara:strand:+ start:197 stop:331 length:135 start_codon:yes stop_codon:yes gene_type:complete